MAREGQRERGAALVLSLILLTLMIVLVSQLAWTTRVEDQIARNAGDDLKMVFAARGALAFAKAHMRADRADPQTARVDSLRHVMLEALNQPLTIGDVRLQLAVEDCERRLNINLLADPETRPFAEAVLLRLVQRLEIEDGEEVVQRIVEYMGGEYTAGEGLGAGGPQQGEASAAGHRVLGVEELLQIEEIPLEVWVGEEDPDLGVVRPGLLSMLTAWGTGKLNLNTMPLDLFWAVLPPEDAQESPIDRDQAILAIEEFRTGGTEDEPPPMPVPGEEMPGQDFTQVRDLTRIPGLQDIFPRQQQGGPGGGGPGGSGPGAGGEDEAGEDEEQREPLPQERLTTMSQDFVIRVEAEREGMLRRFEGLLRRGDEAFSVLYWREVAR